MSEERAVTDPHPIPERWRPSYEGWQKFHEPGGDSDYSFEMRLAEELGTAESLVRDLAQALITVPEKLRIGGFKPTAEAIEELLSRIPKDLRP